MVCRFDYKKRRATKIYAVVIMPTRIEAVKTCPTFSDKVDMNNKREKKIWDVANCDALFPASFHPWNYK